MKNLVLFSLLLSLPISSWAKTLVVTALANSGPGSLREAVSKAQDEDRIRFEVRGTISLSEKIVIDKSLSIEGPGVAQLAIDGGKNSSLFEVLGVKRRMSISDLSLKNGVATGAVEGGAVFFHGMGNALQIKRVSFIGNSALEQGGAICSHTLAEAGVFPLELEIFDSTFQNNESENTGGAISAIATRLRIVGSTFYENKAFQAGAIDLSNSRLELLNSTLTQNHSDTDGGAVSMGTGSFVSLSFDTITGNTAVHEAGGLEAGNGRGLVLINSIVAGNQSPVGPDLIGAHAVSLGSNIIGDGTDVFGWRQNDLVGSDTARVDPKLGPLAEYGGPTRTQVPLPGSPVIDFVQSCVDWNGIPIERDQRGVRRPQPESGRCDAGAVEVR